MNDKDEPKVLATVTISSVPGKENAVDSKIEASGITREHVAKVLLDIALDLMRGGGR